MELATAPLDGKVKLVTKLPAVVTAMLMESVSTELASVCTGGKEQIVLRG